MWTLAATLLGQIVNGAIAAYGKSKDVTIAAIQSSAGLAAAQVQAMSLWIGHPLSPPSIMAYAVAIWFFKAVAVDKVIAPAAGLHWSTDPLSGETAAIAGLVVAGMFSAGVVRFLKASP
jgi:hypothetical protein